MKLSIENELDRLELLDCQDDSAKKSLEQFKLNFEESFQPAIETEHGEKEIRYFIRHLDSILKDTEYLKDESVHTELINNRLIMYLPSDCHQKDPCQCCEEVKKLMNSVIQRYRM